MFAIQSLLILLTVSSAIAQSTFQRSSKRGLVFVPDPNFPDDNDIWVRPGSDMTWYYNYGPQPSGAFPKIPQSEFEFVPMLWGAPTSGSDNSFLDTVTALVKGGRNITHVLSFNEPDMPYKWGGSQIDVAIAAEAWKRVVAPLQSMGIKVGFPAIAAWQTGLDWLRDFFVACSTCKPDFLPVHFYGSFDKLEAFLANFTAIIPKNNSVPFWITEYAYDHASLELSQSFFNSTAKLFDSSNKIERYSYFGAFRSNKSNVGPNPTFLTSKGQLTDIGSWYLGGPATGNIPSRGTRQGVYGIPMIFAGALTVFLVQGLLF